MTDDVRRIADAVLYEGYLLWPYRRSALKNQQRWNFGCVMPARWSAEHPDEVSQVGTQVLIRGDKYAEVDVSLRFLHVVHRQVFDAAGRPIDQLTDGGVQYLTWDEATEREVSTPGRFTIPAGIRVDALAGGRVEHSWRKVTGTLVVELQPVAAGLQCLSVEITNTDDTSPWHAGASPTTTVGTLRTIALNRAFCSAHLVLRVRNGAFESPLDESSQARCVQRRMWPVLVGEAPDRSTILATEIMLEEYPHIAPESPGDLFDGGEVDQLLTLNILGMTDAERAEMRASDPRARAILERTEAMTAADLMRLHGTIRDRQPVDHQ